MRKQTKLWTTRDGRRIRICDMDDSHLKNTIAMLERGSKVSWEDQLYEAACMMSWFSGDSMASYYADQGFDNASQQSPDDFLPDIYYNLCDDRQRRQEAS